MKPFPLQQRQQTLPHLLAECQEKEGELQGVEVDGTEEGRDGADNVEEPGNDDSSDSGVNNAAEPGRDNGNNDAMRPRNDSSKAVETQKSGSEDDIILLGNINPEPEHTFFVGLRDFLLLRHGN